MSITTVLVFFASWLIGALIGGVLGLVLLMKVIIPAAEKYFQRKDDEFYRNQRRGF